LGSRGARHASVPNSCTPQYPLSPPKSGKQKTPEWLAKALGKEAAVPEGLEGKTLEDLLRAE
jgi:hypothetical protein